MSIDPNNLGATAHLTFADDFNGLSLWNGSSGTWATTFWYQDVNGNGGTLASNGEQEWYINSNYGPTSGVKPWVADNGVLTITASPTPSWLKGQVNNYGYISGELNTFHSFAQTYGYFEMRAQLPAGQGFWPAFWLMPENGAWPPELDVVETIGQTPTGLITTVHSNAGGSYWKDGLWTQVPDTSAGYHTYGMDWEPDYITWYFDGQPVHKVATPSDLNTPMYMIANLAAGGYWPGSVDGWSSAQLKIDYIRAYASGAAAGGGSSGGGSSGGGSSGGGSSGGSSASVTVSASNYTAPSGVTSISLSGWNQTIQANGAGDTIYSNNSQNHLYGGTGNDTFYLGRGGDSAASGGGTDTFVFKEVPWTGGHIGGFTGQDVLDLAFLKTYGYGGSNPIADGRLKLVADGAGGTQVWVVLDGLPGASGTWLVTTLDGIGPANLAWQNGHLVDPPTGTGGSTGGSTGGGSTGGSGQVFNSDNNGDHWTGTSGADTFNLGRGGDVVAGNGGSDTFKFAELPWNGGHITDFGTDDVLDLSAMFTRYGYYGSNPIGEGRLKLVADGAGGTQVWFDMSGLSGGSGNWLVTTLDHVAPSSLSMSAGKLTEGGSTGGGSTGGSTGGTGQVFTSSNGGDHWTGTSANDTFNVGRGGDVLAGNGGNDTFAFKEIPWARAEITDFGSGDQISLQAMFQRYGYAPSDPVADGRLKIVSDGADGAQLWFVADGLSGASGTWQLAQLDHVSPWSLHATGAFITG